jgi:hypothetical protein
MDDQIEAASLNNMAAFRRLVETLTLTDTVPEQQWTAAFRQADLLQRTYVLAAVMGVRNFCPHTDDGPQPVIVALSLHRTVCFACARHHVSPPPDESDRCDVCGSRGHEFFTPVAMAFGPMTVIGDACDACAKVLIRR